MNAKSFSRKLGGAMPLLLVIGLATGPAPAAHARATFTVDSTLDAVDASPGDGLCADATGACTLRAAIQEANALAGDDSITLPAGTYPLTIPGADEDAGATGDLDITDDLTVTGDGAATTIIDGNGGVTDDRVFEIHVSAVVTIQRVVISHGNASAGGGIFNHGTLTLEGSRLHGNRAGKYGGGIYNFLGTLTLTDSTLSGNKAIGRFSSSGAISNYSGTMTISNSTLSDNLATTAGGAIYNYGFDGLATLTISQSTLSGNQVLYKFGASGGAIYNNYGTVTITRSTLSGNLAPRGTSQGGAISHGEGTMAISYSTLSGNSADCGGGIWSGGTLTITHTTLSNNLAGEFGGGGIANFNGPLTISYSTFSNNSTSGYGGAMDNCVYIDIPPVTISHSTLSGNLADIGGGIYNYGDGLKAAALTITHSTLSANSATTGGGIYNAPFVDGTVTSQSTILAGNAASMSGLDCSGTLTSEGYNLIGNNSDCTFNATTGDLVGTPDNPIDPLLAPLQDNGGPTWTHALLIGSPAIDTGTPTDCPPTDQRGYPSPVDGDGDGNAICDIGAYEYGAGP